MLKLSKIVLALTIIMAVQSCKKGEEKTTASGLKYTLVEKGDGEEIKDGQFLILNMQYKDENDSVWMSTAERGIPILMPKSDSVWNNSQDGIEQIFSTLTNGDSVTFQMSTAEFFEKTVRAPMPPNVNQEGSLSFAIGVEDVINEDEAMEWQQKMMQKQQAKMEKDAAEQLTKDVDLIEQYLEENNIDAQKTESGLYYVVKEEGNGEKPEAGDTVKVNYAGYVLNGPYFDTNIKEVAQEKELYSEQRDSMNGYEPLEFPLGQGRVIKGWDEGIGLLKKGSKATLYIPSPLAYGPRQRSAEIKANSILVFDVELVDVKK